MPSRPASTICWAATRWGRAMSWATAPRPARTCVPGVRPRPGPEPAAAPAGRGGRRRELPAVRGLPQRSPARRAASTVLLPGRAHVRGDQRHLHPVERAAGVYRGISELGVVTPTAMLLDVRLDGRSADRRWIACPGA